MDDNTLFLRALLRQDWETYNKIAAELEQQGKGTPVAIIGFAFHIAVRRYFGSRREPAEVIRFVADARGALSEGRDIPVREAEALMYATLDIPAPDVEETIKSMGVGKIAEIEGQLLFKLIADENLTDEQLDGLLMEAEQFAAQRRTTAP
jgi:hypothetical protein